MLKYSAIGGCERLSGQATGAILALMGVGLGPMISDCLAGGEPDALMALCIFNETLQRGGAAWPADKAAVQADGHHAPAFRVERVETILEVAEKLIARVEPLRGCKAHVIGVERIGHNQLIARLKFHPIGQIISIAVGDIGKLPGFCGQADCVFRATPRVPAARRCAHDLCVQTDGLRHICGLIFGAGIFIFDPFEPMAGNLPSGRFHRSQLLWRAGQGGGHAINGDGQVFEHAMQPPKSCARAVFIDAFHVPMALAGPGGGADDLGQKGFRGRIPMQYVVFAAFFIVQHQLNRNFGASGPLRCGRGWAISGHIAWVTFHNFLHLGLSLCLFFAQRLGKQKRNRS